jgi:hypothetical protein
MSTICLLCELRPLLYCTIADIVEIPNSLWPLGGIRRLTVNRTAFTPRAEVSIAAL